MAIVTMNAVEEATAVVMITVGIAEDRATGTATMTATTTAAIATVRAIVIARTTAAASIAMHPASRRPVMIVTAVEAMSAEATTLLVETIATPTTRRPPRASLLGNLMPAAVATMNAVSIPRAPTPGIAPLTGRRLEAGLEAPFLLGSSRPVFRPHSAASKC